MSDKELITVSPYEDGNRANAYLEGCKDQRIRDGYRKPSPELREKINKILRNEVIVDVNFVSEGVNRWEQYTGNILQCCVIEIATKILALIVPKDKAVLSEEEIKELGLVTYDEKGDIDDVDIGGIAQAQRDKEGD